MRKNRSKYLNPKYPNLYRYPKQRCWIFRKYSAEKRREFTCSTGIESLEKSAPAAYKVGVERFNAWLGSILPRGRKYLIRDIARAVLASKDDPALSEQTYRCTRIQVENHIIPAFGSLSPDQVTASRWREYQTAERKRKRTVLLKDGTSKTYPPRTKLFNTHKTLLEILRRAKEEGLIERLPVLELKDGEPAPPRYIPKETVLRIIRCASRKRPHFMKLWALIMWKQGARPTEILNYRYSMFLWSEGTHGMIDIPAAITKNRRARKIPLNPLVARIVKWLSLRTQQDLLFPSWINPGQPIREYKTAWETTMQRLGLDFDPYNLRDTFISNKLRDGVSSTFIGKYCDNSAAIIEKKYAVAIDEVMERIAT